MSNRHKILLRDHLVLEVYLETCPQHYTVSAVPETRATAQRTKQTSQLIGNVSLLILFDTTFYGSRGFRVLHFVRFSAEHFFYSLLELVILYCVNKGIHDTVHTDHVHSEIVEMT